MGRAELGVGRAVAGAGGRGGGDRTAHPARCAAPGPARGGARRDRGGRRDPVAVPARALRRRRGPRAVSDAQPAGQPPSDRGGRATGGRRARPHRCLRRRPARLARRHVDVAAPAPRHRPGQPRTSVTADRLPGNGPGVVVDPGSPTPPYEQIRAQIVTMIEAGTLPAGAQLPTIRQLAADLGLAANTVARAYRELEAGGWVVSRVRHGTSVAARRRVSEADVRRRLHEAAHAYAVLARRLGVGTDEAIEAVRSALAEDAARSARPDDPVRSALPDGEGEPGPDRPT
ncbi:MAG: GntR family transcriptional regulator [Micromonosporaceae bacterium]|nr:GntR family transcriptional regulator [Micromonosporaceae bacterium]